MITLVEPDLERLPEYIAALSAGWSPSTSRDVSGEQLAAVRTDPAGFFADLTRHDGGTIALHNSEVIPRLPGRVRWIWDYEFCGSINLRFSPGTLDLPVHVAGHIGYAIVPWKRRRGYATRALALMLPMARELGLPRVLVTCDIDNDASRHTIEANGGVPDADMPVREELGGRKLRFWLPTTD